MDPPFDLTASLARAKKRLADASSPIGQRKERSDRGALRIARPVLTRLTALLSGQDYPGSQALQADLEAYCQRQGLRCPSRATIYKLMGQLEGPRYAVAELPLAAREALYNQSAEAVIPGRQVVFYCFNYGSLAAIQYAAGLPWLPLYQAYRVRGWRPKSRGLLKAVMVAREIARG